MLQKKSPALHDKILTILIQAAGDVIHKFEVAPLKLTRGHKFRHLPACWAIPVLGT